MHMSWGYSEATFQISLAQLVGCNGQEGALAEAVGEPVDDEESAALDASLAGKKKKKKKPKVSAMNSSVQWAYVM